ncbi:amino acid adenylation domain-containing protein [Micromonospora viridifaciens]|uniref:Phenyloxazoline synthase MbtB n=1 Tax=Micromonospora viridifaciens TaxID=1881 RepID=A0A1C4WUM9_MICVI|nr:non-ribosomal peptide synthetase [Micromonospora viridifaciens]SCE99947.1 amino acid adenylation domain-containing protein [Micromonospora viridifaciens]
MTDHAIDGGIQATTLLDILRDNAARDPGALAFAHLTYPAGTDTSDGRGVAQELTRAAYDRRSAALAAILAPHLGPAGRVLVLLAPGLDFLVGLTGVMYAGGVAVACPPPVDGAGDPRTERAVQIAGNAEVTAVVTTAELVGRLGELRERLGADVPWYAVDRVDESAADGWSPPELTGDDLALLQYTSGSTGAPKGVMVSHRNLLHQIAQTAALAGLPAGANVVSWISPYHALGVAGHLLLSQYLGGRAVFLTPEDFVADPLRWLRAISDTPGPVFGCAPNFAFERCLAQVPAERRAGLDLSGWHTTFNAAERVRAETVRRFCAEFAPYGFRPETMSPGFGMTEAMLFLTGRHGDPEPLILRVDAAELEQGRVVTTDGDDRSLTLVGVGPHGPHCEILVVDPATRAPLDDDRVGELWVRGAVVCQGYWQRPELSAETFGARLADGRGPFLRTGDLGFRYAGELVLCGRLKEMIIIRGRNLYPQDVEMTCERVHPALKGAPAAAFAVDQDGEERLVVVQSIADTDGVDLDDLARRLRAAVTNEHEVEAYEVLLVGPDGVAKTVSGKVQRGACRDRYLAGELRPLARAGRPVAAAPAGPQPAAAPMRDMLLALDEALRAPVLVAELRRRLAALLGTTADRVSLDLPLAGLGLESLRAIELRRDLERDLGVGIPIAEFMRGTVAGLAGLVTGQLDAAPGGRDIAWRPVVADPEHRHEPFPLTEQQYAYFVGRAAGYDLGEVSIHIYVEIDATGLDLDRLTRALNQLVARQEMLRAVVRTDGTQQILPADQVPPVEIAVVDLSELDPAERDAQLAKTRDELSHQVLPMDHWPMFEVRASRLSGGTTRVHVSLDLLVADVASVRLFFLEWGDHYADPQAHPDPLPVSFRDYVLALDQVTDSEAYRRSRDYWLARIADLPPGPDLPLVAGTDRRHRRRRSHLLDAPRWARLRARAARRGLTPSVVQLAAFAEVLGRYSRSGRFTVNVPLFNRMPLHPRIDDIIGDFTAVTLLEIDVTPRDGLGGLAERIQRQLWQDLEHRYFSGVEVMRELSRQRGVPPGTFATVIFASAREQGRDQEGAQGALGSAWLGETVSVVSQTPQVLFDHQVYEDHGALSYHWDVIEALFPDAMLDDLFAAYTDLLERLADSDDAWVPGALEPLPAGQRELIAAAHADTAQIPDELLFTAIGRRAAVDPERTAVVAADATLTYGQLWRRATALGRTLRADGVRPNQLVAVAADKSAAQLVAALAVQLAGGAYLPIDPDLPRARQDHQLRRGEVGVVLVRAGGPNRDDWPAGLRVVPVDAGADPAGEVAPLEPAQRPEDLAYVLFTSGSTGAPKGVMLSHRATLTTVAQVRERCGLGPDDVALGLSALSFDLSVWDVFGVLGAGATLVLPEPDAARDPARWLELMAQHRVTTWNSVPALAQMLVEQAEPDGGHPGLAGLRLMWLSGDWIPVTLPERVRALAPDVRFVASGGPTETAIWCVAYDVGTVDPAWESIPYGRPLANHRINVLNDRMRPCPVGVPGEMFIGGAGLADGYWRDPELTAASFVTHPETGERLYRSGDLGRWLPDGNLQILGRDDFQVKIGGFRIELGEIEATLGRHPGVREAAVVAAGPDRQRRRLVAFVVPAAGAGDPAANGAGPAGTDLDPKVAEKKVLGDVEADPVRRAEFTLARRGLRTDLTGTPVELPSTLDGAAADALWARRASRRAFADRPVPLADLAGLLECLCSRDGEVLPKYRYASAGALYPVQTYVHVRPGRVEGLAGGSYYHDPVAHRLVPVRPGVELDRAVHVSTNQSTFDGSAFEIFLVARMSAIEPLYGNRALHFCLLEAGEMSQLLDDAAPVRQLGLCQLGLIADEEPVRDLLALAPDDRVLHSLLGGVLDPAPRPAGGGSLADRLRAHAAETLPHYMVPASVVTLDRLPLTARGKVDRAALERLADTAAEAGRGRGAAYAAPGSAVERTATEVFQRILGVDRIGVDDRFFDLGADSVTIVKIYRALCAALGRTFPLMHMFEHPTIRLLAASLDGGGGPGDSAVDEAFSRAAARRGRRSGREAEAAR